MYPNNIISVENIKELFELLFGKVAPYNNVEGKIFETNHSMNNVANQWKNAIAVR
jgi:hypothetical protein